jgi:hypothetical protein
MVLIMAQIFLDTYIFVTAVNKKGLPQQAFL